MGVEQSNPAGPQLGTQAGGTGVDTSSAPNGSLLIGNGGGLSLGTLTAGTGITITNGSGSITVTNSGSGSGTVTHTTGALTAGQLLVGNGGADVKTGDLTGDVSTAGSSAATLASVGTAGTYTKVTTDAKGRVTAGAAAQFSDVGGIASPGQLSSGVNNQTGTAYTVVDGDRGKLLTISNAAAVAVTLPQAGAAGQFINGWFLTVRNRGTGAVMITPSVSTIDGAASLTLLNGQRALIVSDGTNYFTG